MKRRNAIAATVVAILAVGVLYAGSYFMIVRPRGPVPGSHGRALFGPGGVLAQEYGRVRYADNETLNAACRVFYWPMEKVWRPQGRLEPWGP